MWNDVYDATTETIYKLIVFLLSPIIKIYCSLNNIKNSMKGLV